MLHVGVYARNAAALNGKLHADLLTNQRRADNATLTRDAMLTPALLVHACTALHPAVPHASYRPFIIAPRRATLPSFCEQPAKESKHDGAWQGRLATVRTAVSKEVKQRPEAAKKVQSRRSKSCPSPFYARSPYQQPSFSSCRVSDLRPQC